MRYFYLLLFFIALNVLVGFSQKEANIWILDIDYCIDFNSGTPELVCPPPSSECGNYNQPYCDFFFSTQSGSSICDESGNLLMYTNGEVVWNATYDTMLLGQYLYGNQYSNQCLIIPRPQMPHRYYVFVTNYILWNSGVRYSEVDMTLDGGLGAVLVPYNHLLLSPACQKVTAVHHANGIDIWVLAHEWESNAFHAVLVTMAGVSSTPVISNVGSYHGEVYPMDPYPMANHGTTGEMKFSVDGSKVILANRGWDFVELFDFDNSTGILSSPIKVNLEGAENVEFSPDGTLAYFSNNSNFNMNLDTGRVYQMDLLAGDSSAIVNTCLVISPLYEQSLHFMQLSPCGRIFDTGRSSIVYLGSALSIIQSPNTPGVGCNYDISAYPTEQWYCSDAQIHMMPNFFRSALDRNIMFENQCFGDTSLIYTLTNTDFDSIRWVFEDSLTGVSFTIPNQDSVYHGFSEPGSYEIFLKRYRNGNLSEIKKRLYVYPQLNINFEDTTICEGVPLNLQVNDPYCQFAWVNDFSNDTVYYDSVSILQGGEWWPIVSNYAEFCLSRFIRFGERYKRGLYFQSPAIGCHAYWRLRVQLVDWGYNSHSLSCR